MADNSDQARDAVPAWKQDDLFDEWRSRAC